MSSTNGTTNAQQTATPVIPKVGQRVRTTAPLLSSITGEPIPVGTLADVTAVNGGLLDLCAYISTGDKTPARHVPVDSALPTRVSICRGRPYVPGADPKRRGGEEATSGKSSGRSTARQTANAPDGLAEAIAEAVRGVIGGGAQTSGVTMDDVEAALTPLVERVDEVERELCGGIDGVRAEVGELHDRITAVLDALSTATPAVKAKVRVALGVSQTTNPITDALARYYEPNVPATANVLLCSPPSFGKSYGVREYGRAYDLYLEHGCSDDIDEVPTLLGNPVPDGNGGFVVADGILTQAVRAASDGRSVLLLLDEVLRLAPRAQEWLLTFLAGFKDGSGARGFRLTTRRVMADGTFEVLHCGADKLHIVAATNLGIVTPVEAFWSRWEKVRFAFSLQATEGIAKSVLAAYGFSGPEADSLALCYAGAVESTRRYVVEGRIAFPVDIRLLERAASHPSTATAREVALYIADRLPDNVTKWDADLGDVDAVSLQCAQSVADSLVTAFDALVSAKASN